MEPGRKNDLSDLQPPSINNNKASKHRTNESEHFGLKKEPEKLKNLLGSQRKGKVLNQGSTNSKKTQSGRSKASKSISLQSSEQSVEPGDPFKTLRLISYEISKQIGCDTPSVEEAVFHENIKVPKCEFTKEYEFEFKDLQFSGQHVFTKEGFDSLPNQFVVYFAANKDVLTLLTYYEHTAGSILFFNGSDPTHYIPFCKSQNLLAVFWIEPVFISGLKRNQVDEIAEQIIKGEKNFRKIEEEVKSVSQKIQNVEEEVSSFKEEVSSFKEEVKQELKGIKEEVKQELKGIKEEMKESFTMFFEKFERALSETLEKLDRLARALEQNSSEK
jgi:uncharacterized protein YukE